MRSLGLVVVLRVGKKHGTYRPRLVGIIGATTVGTAEDWSPQFVGRRFQKARNFTTSSLLISTVVTRMHDLASAFSKIFRGDTPDPHSGKGSSGRGRPPVAPNTQPGLWPGAGRKRPGVGRPGVGTQTLVPSTFQPWLRPWLVYHCGCVFCVQRPYALDWWRPVWACHLPV